MLTTHFTQELTPNSVRPSIIDIKWNNKIVWTPFMNELRHNHRRGFRYVTEETTVNMKTKNKQCNKPADSHCVVKMQSWVSGCLRSADERRADWTTLQEGTGLKMWPAPQAVPTSRAVCARSFWTDVTTATSSLKFKKQSEAYYAAIRMLSKHTSFAGYNKDCQ